MARRRGARGLTLDENLLDVLGPDLAAVLEELVVFAGRGEVDLGATGEGLHAAVGGRGEAGGGGGEGREGILAAAVGRSDFPPHESGLYHTRRGDGGYGKSKGERAGWGRQTDIGPEGNIYTAHGWRKKTLRDSG